MGLGSACSRTGCPEHLFGPVFPGDTAQGGGTVPKSLEIAPLGHSTNPPVNTIICLFLTHTLTFTLVSKAQGVGHASRAAGWGVDCHGLGILRKTDEARPTLPGLPSSGGRHCCPKSWVSGNLLLVMKGTHGFCAPSMCHSGDPMSGFEDLDGKVRSI